MSKTMLLPVSDLAIDLHNFRTVPQKDELEATRAMISISPDFFWGLMGSLLEDGYLPTENIIVVEDSSGVKCVREGNRRVASLKIMLGIIDRISLDLPPKIAELIEGLHPDWIRDNSNIPCAIYGEVEEEIVDKIVARTHGKGSKEGRDIWDTVARARHNRDKNSGAENTLDLLEKYLVHGDNFTQEQKARWAGRYNLTVLEEAIKRISPRFCVASSAALVQQYPSIQPKKALDDIMHAIGMGSLGFTVIRASGDFALGFGVPAADPSAPADSGTAGTSAGAGAKNFSHRAGSTGGEQVGGTAEGSTSSGGGSGNPQGTGTSARSGLANNGVGQAGKTRATATTDERSVKKSLRALKIYGPNRAKLETIRKECLKLDLKDNPIAFCFLLRSLFEISAKAYCQDKAGQPDAPTTTKNDGNDRALADVLRDIVSHLTQNNADKKMVKHLHGPLTEIQRPDGILSLTSMNQLVHNSSFTILSSDIPSLFSNIFPLLENMNK